MDMSRNGDWSKLCPDVLLKIFKTLRNPIDSHRAKTVCSDWYSVWKTLAKKPRCPSWIIHEGHMSTRQSTRKIVGLSETSYCLTSSGNWLLMVDRRLKFYILNLLTRERINLASMESSRIRGEHVSFQAGNKKSDFGYMVGPCGRDYVSYEIDDWKKTLAVLWINETTKDYVVAWTFKRKYLFSHKRGYGFWCNMNINGQGLGVLDIACENSKLYLFTNDYHIKIFEFSGGLLIETQNPYSNHRFDFVEYSELVWGRKLAIRKSGEVLIVLSLRKRVNNEVTLLFYIFKMNLESCKWERVDSIGDEMLIFGRGVTVPLALEDLGDGIKRDSIYFLDEDMGPDHGHRVSNCGVFDIATSRVEWPKKIYFSFNEIQWFVRGVAY